MKNQIAVTQQENGWMLDTGHRLTHQEAAPVEVIRQVHGYAISKKLPFPLELNISTKEGTLIPLILQANGSTAKNPKAFHQLDESVETEVEENAHPRERKEESLDKENHPATGSTRAPESKAKKKRILVPLGIGSVALLLLGGCTAYVLTSSHTEDSEKSAVATASETTPKTLYEIPETEKVVSLAGTYLVGSQDDQLKVTDVLTQKSVLKEGITINPDNLRAQTYQGNTVIDGGKGKVLLLRNGKQKSIDGVMNTRGTVPVIVSKDFKKYTMIGQTTKEVPEKASLLGATEKNLLFVKAPAKIEYSKDGRSVEIEPPSQGAKLKAWVAGTEDRAMTIWGKDSKTWLVVSDTQNKGKTVLKEEIPKADAVSYIQGHVIVSEKQVLENDKLQPLCEPGKWIDGNRWCEDNGQWKYKEQSLTQEPELITDQYLVTEHKVEEK